MLESLWLPSSWGQTEDSLIGLDPLDVHFFSFNTVHSFSSVAFYAHTDAELL